MTVYERVDADEVFGQGGDITVPTPLSHCRLEKRPLEASEEECSRVKRTRLEDELKDKTPKAPATFFFSQLDSCGSEPVTTIIPVTCPPNYTESDDYKRLVNGPVRTSVQIFKDVWTDYATYRYWHGDEKAVEVAESLVSSRYQEACDALVDLLPFTNGEEMQKQLIGDVQKHYTVMQFQGCSSSLGLPEGYEDKITTELNHLRDASMWGYARVVFCAMLAVLSSRKEKVWLEGFAVESDIKDQLKWKRNKHAMLYKGVSEIASGEAHDYFAPKLVDSSSTFHVAFTNEESRLRPASLIITHFMPLKEAFEHMDGKGPLKKVPYSWFQKPSRQFALQEFCFGDKSEREHTRNLTPEPAIKELLGSRRSVVFLDVYAALAPRSDAKKYGIGKVVQSELMALLRQAKSQGQAVVFMLGGDDDRMLAEKVYLRPQFTEDGLRCGYLRWRESLREPWAREKLIWENRVSIGLQLP